jgi:hypothetical protein
MKFFGKRQQSKSTANMTSNGSANGSLLTSSSVPGPGPTGASCDNPGYDRRVNGVELSPLLNCDLAEQMDAIAKLLEIKRKNIALVDKLINFLREQDVLTFEQVGGLPDKILAGMVLRMETMTPPTTPGTFAYFLTLRDIFRPMVLLKEVLLRQQGKREKNRTRADIFIQVRVSIFFLKFARYFPKASAPNTSDIRGPRITGPFIFEPGECDSC